LRTVPPPERLPGWLSWIPLVSGVAVLRTVQAVAGFTPTLKWPNDVLVGDRKLGGVLCESSGFGTTTAVMVVGIGVNVNESRDSFPDELRAVATSLFAETGCRFDRVTLLAGLLSEVEARSAAILSTTPAAVREEYMRLCSTLGRRVQVTLATGESLRGLADSIEPDGGLRIIHDGSGQELTIRAGDVLHLR
jgi:BirA family biotin operon repressor/biotin-[acetyl-CoA-carboxylase] ligase